MDQKPSDPPPPYPGVPNPASGPQPGPHAPGFVPNAPGISPNAPGYGPPPFQQQPAIVVRPVHTAGVTVITTPGIYFGSNPVQMTCPKCSAQIVTATRSDPGLLTWLVCGACVLLGCWVGCCLIPFCIPDLQDVEHFCPNCKTFLGSNRRC